MSVTRCKRTRSPLGRRLLAAYILSSSALSLLPPFPAEEARAADANKPGGVDLASMDSNVSPCDDFFQYACGGWIASHPIPPDESVWGSFSVLEERTNQQLREILERAASGRDAKRRKLGDFHAACMNGAAAEAQGATPLLPWLRSIAHADTAAELSRLIGRLHAQGTAVMFDFFPWQDLDDATMMSAEIFQGGLTLPQREYYLATDPEHLELRRAYRDHILRMLKLVGRDGAVAADQAERILAVETELARASLPAAALEDPNALKHIRTLAQLREAARHFDWDAYLDEVGAHDLRSLNESQPGFTRAVDALFAKERRTDLRAYLEWRAIVGAAPYLSEAFVAEDFAFRGKRLRGAKQLKPRWERCVELADYRLRDLLGEAYVAEHFRPADKEVVSGMVRTIHSAMEQNIRDIDWMTEPTRQRALEKLAAISAKIGYPDRWRDSSMLEIRRDDAYGNVTRASAFNFRLDNARIGHPVDRSHWYMSAPTVNAYYHSRSNDINFPAGQLQPPFYFSGGDPAYNYGGVGAVIGHELTHAFDDEGRHYDGRGNLVSWWQPEDDRRFRERSQCFIEQYSGYSPVAGIRLDGTLTLGENIADNGGSRLAYQAMQIALRKEDRAPRGGFTAEQRYFLGLSQAWCSHATEQLARLRARTDSHSPPRFQVNGAVANMPEFRKAFSCPDRSAMVRPNTCRIW